MARRIAHAKPSYAAGAMRLLVSSILLASAAAAACKSDSATTDAASVASAAPSTSAPSTPSAAPAEASALAPPPAGWWTATPTAGHATKGGWMRLAANEIDFVPSSLGRTEVRDVKLLLGDESRWEWSQPSVGGTIHCTIERTPDSHAAFECTAGTKREAYALVPLADAKRAATLDAAVERARPPKDVCQVAEACGKRVFAQLDSVFDADEELGNPRSPSMCQKAMVGLREMATMKGAPPPECR